MALVEDAAAFLTDFGVSATVGGIALTGIFDNASDDPLGIVGATAPVLLIAVADAPDVAVGDAVIVNSTAYTVTKLQPDGTGMTRLLLK